jgi:DNA-directed RNA polymerase subunit RPC12/RpoP
MWLRTTDDKNPDVKCPNCNQGYFDDSEERMDYDSDWMICEECSKKFYVTRELIRTYRISIVGK